MSLVSLFLCSCVNCLLCVSAVQQLAISVIYPGTHISQSCALLLERTTLHLTFYFWTWEEQLCIECCIFEIERITLHLIVHFWTWKTTLRFLPHFSTWENNSAFNTTFLSLRETTLHFVLHFLNSGNQLCN